MAKWEVNKGVGRPVEFRGLKAQYLFILAGGLLAVFVLTVILYLCGAGQALCLVLCLTGCTLVVWVTCAMNRRYGQHGLMKRAALGHHPKYLINRKTVYHMFKRHRHDKHI